MALRNTKATVFSLSEAKDLMQNIPQWILQKDTIVREFVFKTFQQAIDFVNRVAEAAEAEDHHPDIFISYNKVKLDLSTHSAGGLTSKDFELAKRLDRLV